MALQDKLSDNLQHFFALLSCPKSHARCLCGYSIHMCKCCKISGSIGVMLKCNFSCIVHYFMPKIDGFVINWHQSLAYYLCSSVGLTREHDHR